MMKKKVFFFPILLLLLFFLTTLSFSEEKGNLEKIIISKGEKTLEVNVTLSLFTYYRQFELLNPNRVVIDFFNITKIKTSRFFKVDAFGIRAIRTGQFKPTTARVVFDLIEEVPPYKIEIIEDGLRVLFWPEEEEVVEEEIKILDAICDIKVDPAKANLNDPISVDMSGSQHAQSMEVEVFDKEGTKITAQKLTPESPRWETKFDKPGEYIFRGTAFNIEDKPSENLSEAQTHINFPPVSSLECSPCRSRLKKSITLDASGAADSDGEVVRVDFEITDEEGNLVDRFMATEKPFTWEKMLEDEGVFTVSAIVTDDFGAVSEPAMVKITAREKRLFFLLDVGSLASRGRGTYVIYAGGRYGLLYKILPGTLDFALTGGGAYTTPRGPWKSFYNFNVLFNVHVGPVFIGAGAGFVSRYIETLPKSYVEGVANIGIDMFSISKTKVSILLEALGPVTDYSLKDYHKFLLGFRLTF